MTCLAKLSLGRTLRILLVCGVAQLIVAVPALGKGARGDMKDLALSKAEEEHLRKATDLTAEERTTVERYISECQAKIDNAAAPKAVIQPSIVQATPAADTVQTSPMVPPPPSSEIGNPGRGMRISSD